MKTGVLFCILSFLTLCAVECPAQLYTGMSGLVKNPSADMNDEGDAVIAGYFLNKHFTPGDATGSGFNYAGEKYDTYSFSLALTPFWWLELGYTFTLFKVLEDGAEKPSYSRKDRYMSIKLNPLREGKYYPAIAVGANDFLDSSVRTSPGTNGRGSGFFANYYIVATKHFIPKGQDIGVSLGYRYVPVVYGKKWQGVIAGATWRPKWVSNLRLIGEWTANEFNLGVDCLLWKHLFLQFAMIGCKYPTGGIAYKVNLF